MNKDVFAILEPGEPSMISALDVLKRYHEAKEAGMPSEELEALRHQAEQLFQAVSEYQLRVLECPSAILQ